MPLFILITFITSCSSANNTHQPEYQNNTKTAAIPAECTYTSTAAHDFFQWPEASSDQYSCSTYAKLTCTFWNNDDHREMFCQNDPANPSGPPNGCSKWSGDALGIHDFVTFGQLWTKAYDCGVYYGMRCFYYLHSPDGDDSNTREEIRCLDNQLPL